MVMIALLSGGESKQIIPQTVMITSTIMIRKWLLIMIVLSTLPTQKPYPSVVWKSWTSLHDPTA